MTLSLGIKIIGSAIVVLIILLYAYARIEPFARGPQIVITFPSNGLTVLEPLLVVEGIIAGASHITFNGRQIYTSETGELNERMLLSGGYNVIELNASDRFERTTKRFLEIMYK